METEKLRKKYDKISLSDRIRLARKGEQATEKTQLEQKVNESEKEEYKLIDLIPLYGLITWGRRRDANSKILEGIDQIEDFLMSPEKYVFYFYHAACITGAFCGGGYLLFS